MIEPFNFTRIPSIVFGRGKLDVIFNLIPQFGNNLLLVTGSNSLKKAGKWDDIILKLDKLGINYWNVTVNNEPSPQLIDNTVNKFRKNNINIVLGIGGGSVTDAGKAISAMLLKSDSIRDYLEGVGNKNHDGVKIPYIAVPTTSGTGSEATKNTVISEIGIKGYKKSLRHDNLVPDYAIIDPELMISCPPSITAACGMDAFTQLLEAYTSTKASTLTDTLAYIGMQQINDAIISACSTGASDVNIRASMAYGSLLSGIVLANAGLGIIHGLASSIGGYFDIPHGVVCGTLLAESTKKNIEKLIDLGSKDNPMLLKFAKIGALLKNQEFSIGKDIIQLCYDLIEILKKWTENLKIPPLGIYGIKEEHLEKIVKGTSLKNNPVRLDKEDITEIILKRL